MKSNGGEASSAMRLNGKKKRKHSQFALFSSVRELCEMRYTIASPAYWTVVLHAARYPQHAVSGVLIGKKIEGGVAIMEAVALFHTQVLAPMLEIALIQVRMSPRVRTRKVLFTVCLYSTG